MGEEGCGGWQEEGGGGEGEGYGYLQEVFVVAGARGYRGGEERFARRGRQGRLEVHQEQEAEQWPHDQGRREARHGDEGRVLQHVQDVEFIEEEEIELDLLAKSPKKKKKSPKKKKAKKAKKAKKSQKKKKAGKKKKKA